MLYLVSGLIVILLALIGFTECLRALIYRIFRSKEGHSTLIIYADKNAPCDMEYTLRSWLVKSKWMGKSAPDNIICLTNGMNKTQKEICTKIAYENPYIYLSESFELLNILEKKNT